MPAKADAGFSYLDLAMKTRDLLRREKPCNKSLACCSELHENEKHFGVSRAITDWRLLQCSFEFGGEACGAAKPSRNELRLYNLVIEERNRRIEEIRRLRAEIARLEGQ